MLSCLLTMLQPADKATVVRKAENNRRKEQVLLQMYSTSLELFLVIHSTVQIWNSFGNLQYRSWLDSQCFVLRWNSIQNSVPTQHVVKGQALECKAKEFSIKCRLAVKNLCVWMVHSWRLQGFLGISLKGTNVYCSVKIRYAHIGHDCLF